MTRFIPLGLHRGRLIMAAVVGSSPIFERRAHLCLNDTQLSVCLLACRWLAWTGCDGCWSEVIKGTPDALIRATKPRHGSRRLCQPRLLQQGIVSAFAQADDDLFPCDLDESLRVDELPKQSGRARPDKALQPFGQIRGT